MVTADQSTRERALSAELSFIVQAPAGSGKTELLIQRYLSLLARVREPEEIVAITFTIKAAAEMQERVLEALRRAAAGETGADGIERRRLELARLAMDKDHRFGWQLVTHPARLQIQTIDALCLSLARQLPILSGFAAPAGILEEPRAAYERAAVETIKLLGGRQQSWNDALTVFLTHVDNEIGRATGLIADMLASRDQWLRHIGDDRVSVRNLETAWTAVVEAYLAEADAQFPTVFRPVVVECANSAAAQLADDADAPLASAWLQGRDFPGTEAAELPRWQFLAELLMTRNTPQWRKQVNKNQGFPAKSDAKQAMQGLLEDLAGAGDLAARLFGVKSLPEPRLDADQARTLEAMVTVLTLAVAQLRLVFEDSGRVDFVEITERAIAALGSLEEPSDLALKLDYRIEHLLVDEFQDTSIAQYRLLQLLTQGWAPGDGKTLFLVGDPMQSIYRFREAEVAVFLMVRDHGIGTVPIEPLTLQSNFRSSPAIVDWVNRVFGDCFPRESEPRSGAVAYAESIPQRAGAGETGVHVYPAVDGAPAQQAEHLASLIGDALTRSRDVAVLVRARPHLNELLPALQRRDIPYTGVDITALANEPVVRDLHSLTRALLHFGDRVAWLSLLRAPWCGLTLADLTAVASTPGGLIPEALRDDALRGRLSADGLARLDRFLHAMAGPLVQRGRLSLQQWVRRAWVDLGGPALVDDAGLDHAHAYLALLGRHQQGMWLADGKAFEDALQSHWAHAEARDGAVQLMTIHKAKGLEFDEVFLPALDRAEPPDDKRLLLWEEPVGDEGLLLATLSEQGAPEGRHYRFLRGLQVGKSANETDRLLYVACTRARNRLHLTANLASRDGEVPDPVRASLLARIWPHVRAQFNDTVPAPNGGAAAASGSRPPRPFRRLPLYWTPPPCPASPDAPAPAADEPKQVEFSWAGETARLVGILVHEVIRHIAASGLAGWDRSRVESLLPAWRRRLAHAGVRSIELDNAVRRVFESIVNMLDDPRSAWLLSDRHTRIENEYDLSAMVDGRVRRFRIDRTFVDDQGVRWIVDYKTGAHEGGSAETFLDREVDRYRAQMESYAATFYRMGAEDIRLVLYFPMLRGWREWPYSR